MMGSQNDRVIADKKSGPANMAETVALARVLESENMESTDYKKAYFHGKNANREVSELAAFAYAVVI
jgi:O-methyltransferase involved in polyketide biosynthesis